VRTFTWDADDPDGDRLLSKLEIRSTEDTAWLTLVESVEDNFFSWDARAMPDGAYRVRLTVNDAPDNPSGSQASGREISGVFIVDNSRPSVDSLSIREAVAGPRIQFVARDPGGTIAAAEISIDGRPWRAVEPVDGVADSDTERYEVELVREPRGERMSAVFVRVVDGAGNLGGGAVALRTHP
jgi:hypothetical protein